MLSTLGHVKRRVGISYLRLRMELHCRLTIEQTCTVTGKAEDLVSFRGNRVGRNGPGPFPRLRANLPRFRAPNLIGKPTRKVRVPPGGLGLYYKLAIASLQGMTHALDAAAIEVTNSNYIHTTCIRMFR